MADNNSLVRSNSQITRNLQKSLQVGSLDDLVRVRREGNIFLLLDCSGSMSSTINNGKRRITGLRETVRSIQAERNDNPLKMVQFGVGHEPNFITSIPDPSGGTPLHLAIDFARANRAGRAIVISDGIPDSQGAALEAASRFGGRIDVVFVGNPGEPGERFLKQLAESTGGESFTGDLSDPKMLAGKVTLLLTTGSAEPDDEDEEEL